jgi:hypothetical protein
MTHNVAIMSNQESKGKMTFQLASRLGVYKFRRQNQR